MGKHQFDGLWSLLCMRRSTTWNKCHSGPISYCIIIPGGDWVWIVLKIILAQEKNYIVLQYLNHTLTLWCLHLGLHVYYYGDVIMYTIASQITSLTIVYSTIYSNADQRKHQTSAPLAFVRGIQRGPRFDNVARNQLVKRKYRDTRIGV